MEKTPTKPFSIFSVIADSSGLVSLVTTTDRNHAAAVFASKRLLDNHSVILVPGDIFTETINILGKKSGHEVARQTAAQLLDDEEAFIVAEANEEIRRNAFIHFEQQPSSVSFADCLVMAFADYYGIRDIFGFDEVFARNGYHSLLQRQQAS